MIPQDTKLQLDMGERALKEGCLKETGDYDLFCQVMPEKGQVKDAYHLKRDTKHQTLCNFTLYTSDSCRRPKAKEA